jgi:phospholipase C
MSNNLDKIDHIVVLMLENRSFDNMLGWLYDPGNSPPFDEPPRGQSFEGLSGKELSNPIPAYARDANRQVVRPGKLTDLTHPNPDPGEEYYHVNTQLYGTVNPPENRHKPFNHWPYNLPPGGAYDPAPMSGFVTDYINHFEALLNRAPAYDDYAVIMGGFTPDQAPVLSTLANRYAVCDHYHSSVPSQTFCNRSFVHCGGSHGLVVNAPFVNWLFHHADTIFNRIEDDPRPDLTWKVYYDVMDILSITWLLQPKLWKYRHSHFAHMDEFLHDAREGTLPSYSFIEPRLMVDNNDQHPTVAEFVVTNSVRAGELLMHQVYEAVRHGKAWERTLLIITYDEHGGCYDHVPPPLAVPPDPHRPVGQYSFTFDRLGIRLPTVLVSPWIEPGTVVHTLFDHTSIIRTICNRWGLPHLAQRDRVANDFGEVLTREQPRTDLPEVVPIPYVPSSEAPNQPLTALQRAFLEAAAAMEGLDRTGHARTRREKLEDLVELMREEREILHLKTVGEGVDFIRRRLEATYT